MIKARSHKQLSREISTEIESQLHFMGNLAELSSQLSGPSSDSSGVNSNVESLQSYITKKQLVSVEALNMGSLVEETIDKLPYRKQIWFMQKVVKLIAEVICHLKMSESSLYSCHI